MRTAHKVALRLVGGRPAAGGSAPEAPTGLAVTDAVGGVVPDRTPQFTWDAVTGATSYEVEYEKSLTGTPTITGLTDTNYTAPSDLDNFTEYSVQVWARNATGLSAASTTVTFTPKVWLFRDNYTTDDDAPVTSPRTTEPGGEQTTITDTANKVSISGGELIFAGGNGVGDPKEVYATGLARIAGRTLVFGEKFSNRSDERFRIGWSNAANYPNAQPMLILESVTWLLDGVVLPTTPQVNTDYEWGEMLLASGLLAFLKVGANWTLQWLNKTDTTTPMYIASGVRAVTANTYRSTHKRAADLPVFTPTLDVASPVEQAYTGTADALLEITLTAPGSITEEAGIVFRKLDDNNYWRAYFDTAGAFKLDSVASGTPTNRINVAGVITAGAARAIRIIMNGSLLDAYTLNGSTWTKRGAQINISHQNTQTTVTPDVGANWSAANLLSYPLTSAVYNSRLDGL